MNSPRFYKNAAGSSVLVALALTFATFTQAQTPKRAYLANLRARVRADIAAQPNERKPQDQYPQEDLEQMRSALLELVGSIKDLKALAPAKSVDAKNLDDAAKQIQDLSYKQLTALRKGLNPAKMNETLVNARASVAEFKTNIQQQFEMRKSRDAALGPEPDTPTLPSRHAYCYSDRTTAGSPGAIIAADVIYFVAENVRDIAKDGCLEVLIIAGEGGNASVACIITDIIYIVAEGIWEGIHFCSEEFTDATVDANYERLEHIHDDLADAVKQNNDNKTEIINNDNTNKDSIITEIDSKSSDVITKIDAGTTNILTNIESKGNQIITTDNSNRALIINNDNANTTNIINNDNSNKTAIINNENANFAATIAEMHALNCEIIRLLHVPEGLRSSSIPSCAGMPGWPYKWNKTGTTAASTSSKGWVSTATATKAAGTADASENFSRERGQDGVPILAIMGTVTMESSLLTSKLVPTYYLPASRGGLIEQVKLMVWHTIESQTELKIAEVETGQAKVLAQEADQLLAAGKYIGAYRQYCLAYQKLVPTN